MRAGRAAGASTSGLRLGHRGQDGRPQSVIGNRTNKTFANDTLAVDNKRLGGAIHAPLDSGAAGLIDANARKRISQLVEKGACLFRRVFVDKTVKRKPLLP